MMKNGGPSVFDSIENNNINNFEQPNNFQGDNVNNNPFMINDTNNNLSTDNNSDVEVLDFGFEEIKPIEVTTIPDEENNFVSPIQNNVPETNIFSNPMEQNINNSNISDSFQNINNTQPSDIKPRFFTMVQPQFNDQENVEEPNNVFNQSVVDDNNVVNNNYEQPIEENATSVFSSSPIDYPSVMPVEEEKQAVDSSNELGYVPNSNGIVDDSAQNSIDEQKNNLEEPNVETDEQITYLPSLGEIINKMRKCADEIEASGFKIDTEEYDLDDIYQVIFKIEK